MTRIFLCGLMLSAALTATLPSARAQMMQGGGIPGGRGMGGQPGMNQPGEDIPVTPMVEKPDAAAKKAFNAGTKSLNRAKEYEEAAAKAPNEDKKAAATEKMNDALYRALDQFTEVLSNNGTMYDAWANVGYIHFCLGAFRESVDDYDHALKLKPDNLQAIEVQAEAFLALDRLDDTKSAYMDLFNHARPLADQLMIAMQAWRDSHRTAANGIRPADLDSFDKWLLEREGIAKQTASASAPAAGETTVAH